MKNRLFIPAGALIGLGIGMIYNQESAGVLIGMGMGFLVEALFEKKA